MGWMLQERTLLCFTEHHADTKDGTYVPVYNKKNQMSAGSSLCVSQSPSSHCTQWISGQDSQRELKSGSADKPLQQDPVYGTSWDAQGFPGHLCAGIRRYTPHYAAASEAEAQ